MHKCVDFSLYTAFSTFQQIRAATLIESIYCRYEKNKNTHTHTHVYRWQICKQMD